MASNSAAAAHRQQQGYNRCTKPQQFTTGDLAWLSVLTADKLSPHWKGRWKVEEIKDSVNVRISNGSQSKVVHVNRLRHRTSLCQLKPILQTMARILMFNI